MLDLNYIRILPGFDTQLLRGIRTHPCRSVPSQLRKGFRKLLQPSIVGKTPVVDMRVAAEDQFQPLHWLRRRPQIAFRSNCFRREIRPGNKAVVHRAAPEALEVSAMELSLPVRANQLISGYVRLPIEYSQYFVDAVPAIQGRNQRLHDAYLAIRGASIAPFFQIVSPGNDPVASNRSLVRILTVINLQRHLRQDRSKVGINRNRVHRIAAQDQQEIYISGIDVEIGRASCRERV